MCHELKKGFLNCARRVNTSSTAIAVFEILSRALQNDNGWCHPEPVEGSFLFVLTYCGLLIGTSKAPSPTSKIDNLDC